MQDQSASRSDRGETHRTEFIDFSSDSRNQKHFLMLNMSINIDRSIKFVISTEFKLQIQFVMFIRGHPGTPIDPAPVLLSGK